MKLGHTGTVAVSRQSEEAFVTSYRPWVKPPHLSDRTETASWLARVGQDPSDGLRHE